MRNIITTCLGVTKNSGQELEPQDMQLIKSETLNQVNEISNTGINPLEIDLVRFTKTRPTN